MPNPFLLTIHSHPTKVSAETWTQFSLEEHIRDIVFFGVAKNAAFYRASSDTFTSGNPGKDGSEAMEFLAIYQSERPNVGFGKGKSAEMGAVAGAEKVRRTSRLWKGHGDVFEVSEMALREGVLVEVLGRYEGVEDVAPQIVLATLTGDEVEGKIQHEHVNAVACLDGYRRTLLYRFPALEGGRGCVQLVHEFERLEPGFLGSVKAEMEGIEATKDCAFVLRSFELLGAEGFGGRCQRPERLEE